MEKNASADKNRASLFNYNLGYLFFVVAAKQFLLQQEKKKKKKLVPPEAAGDQGESMKEHICTKLPCSMLRILQDWWDPLQPADLHRSIFEPFVHKQAWLFNPSKYGYILQWRIFSPSYIRHET